MSNTTIATKLVTLVKGIFGRTEPVPATGPAKAEETTTAENPVKETAETPTESATEAPETADKAVAEPAKDEAPVEEAEEAKPEEAEPEEAEKAVKAEPEVSAEDVKADHTETVEPAAVDITKDGPAIAEELAVAEAHTEVASDEVLEKVRMGAAPGVDELAVPTYDDLTLPSIRARLRKLTIEQVRDLRAYEVAHQGRPEFIKMYDNRINKMEADG